MAVKSLIPPERFDGTSQPHMPPAISRSALPDSERAFPELGFETRVPLDFVHVLF